MISVRKTEERGHNNHGWLNAKYTFSFAEYHDSAHMQYSVLRVLNEDMIEAAKGFGEHSHRDMEIVTYILSGALRHQDSLGNGSVIRSGDVQRMTAGTGVRHSEFNNSADEVVHLMQIWVLPTENGLPPSYEEKHFTEAQKKNQWCLVASPNGDKGSVTIHQDVNLYAILLDAELTLTTDLDRSRCHYIQVATGSVNANGFKLKAGDAVKVEDEVKLTLLAESHAELLWFDLPVLTQR